MGHLADAAPLQLRRLPELDHAMLHPAERDKVSLVLTDFVRRTLLPEAFEPRPPRAVAYDGRGSKPRVTVRVE